MSGCPWSSRSRLALLRLTRTHGNSLGLANGQGKTVMQRPADTAFRSRHVGQGVPAGTNRVGQAQQVQGRFSQTEAREERGAGGQETNADGRHRGRTRHLPAQPPGRRLAADRQRAVPADVPLGFAWERRGLGRFAGDLAPATRRLAGPVLGGQIAVVRFPVRAIRLCPGGPLPVRWRFVVTGRGMTGSLSVNKAWTASRIALARVLLTAWATVSRSRSVSTPRVSCKRSTWLANARRARLSQEREVDMDASSWGWGQRIANGRRRRDQTRFGVSASAGSAVKRDQSWWNLCRS